MLNRGIIMSGDSYGKENKYDYVRFNHAFLKRRCKGLSESSSRY